MTVPSPQHAAALLAEAARTGARVHREASPAPSGFLITLGFASAGFFLAQPIADGESGVLAAAAVFLLAVGGAALGLLTAQRFTRQGFTHRFGLAMGAWAVVFAVALAAGTTSFPHSWAFWVPLAVLVPVPCLLGAWRELPG